MVSLFGNCPRCGAQVVSIGTYGDRTRTNVFDRLVAEGVPADGKFVLEPCGDIIEAAQLQMRTTRGAVNILFRSV
jgi:hypothetical protein